VRRFNDAFLTSYRVSPSKLRRQSSALVGASDVGELKLKLAYRPPYDWAHLHGFLARRAIGGLEAVDALEYVRAVRTPSGHALVRVRRAEGVDALELEIEGANSSDLMPLVACVQRTFDLTADPARIADALRCDPLLRPLIERRPGLRIPGVGDPFECCIRAVLGRGLSVSSARALLDKFVSKLGRRIHASAHRITHLFPSPDVIAHANLAEFHLSDQRRRALRLVACATRDRINLFDDSNEDIERALAELPGIGRWVAGYVALRGLGEGDALPYGDLVLRREASSREVPFSARDLSARAARWRPFRGYAALHLWSDAANREATSSEVCRQESLWRFDAPSG
jgi:AraC family transcriptional regulator of adaptative response / DNA-3-methyladenine glycosylase II